MYNPEKRLSLEEKQEKRENREGAPSRVQIFAIERTKTYNDTVSRQGFGHSTPLASPEKSITYYWEGKLHPDEFERKNPQSREGYIGSGNASSGIKELAQNFSYNCQGKQSPDLEAQGKASYMFDFEPSEEIVDKFKKGYDKRDIVRVRGLTPEEQKAFMDAFRQANKEAGTEEG